MEKLVNKLTKLIRDELSDSQINKDKLSAEYRLGKNEAYSNVLSIIKFNSTFPQSPYQFNLFILKKFMKYIEI